MYLAALDAPHLPYSISMIIWRHANKTVEWAIPNLTAKWVKDANQITLLH
jgi:hypothetical protein